MKKLYSIFYVITKRARAYGFHFLPWMWGSSYPLVMRIVSVQTRSVFASSLDTPASCKVWVGGFSRSINSRIIYNYPILLSLSVSLDIHTRDLQKEFYIEMNNGIISHVRGLLETFTCTILSILTALIWAYRTGIIVRIYRWGKQRLPPSARGESVETYSG